MHVLNETDPLAVLTPEQRDKVTYTFSSYAEELVRDLCRQLAEAQAEADRWRHGQQHEGDYVCPESLRADAAEAQAQRLRVELGDLAMHPDCTDALRVIVDAALGAEVAAQRERMTP